MSSIDINKRANTLYTYLTNVMELGDEEIESVRDCLGMVHQATPTEAPGIFSRMERIIAASDNLSWVLTSIGRKKSEIVGEIKKIKDPQFTALVRQGRPSIQAIESEIRYTTPELRELESDLDTLLNVESYFVHLEKSMDRYIFLLKDKAQYIK